MPRRSYNIPVLTTDYRELIIPGEDHSQRHPNSLSYTDAPQLLMDIGWYYRHWLIINEYTAGSVYPWQPWGNRMNSIIRWQESVDIYETMRLVSCERGFHRSILVESIVSGKRYVMPTMHFIEIVNSNHFMNGYMYGVFRVYKRGYSYRLKLLFDRRPNDS